MRRLRAFGRWRKEVPRLHAARPHGGRSGPSRRVMIYVAYHLSLCAARLWGHYSVRKVGLPLSWQRRFHKLVIVSIFDSLLLE